MAAGERRRHRASGLTRPAGDGERGLPVGVGGELRRDEVKVGARGGEDHVDVEVGGAAEDGDLAPDPVELARIGRRRGLAAGGEPDPLAQRGRRVEGRRRDRRGGRRAEAAERGIRRRAAAVAIAASGVERDAGVPAPRQQHLGRRQVILVSPDDAARIECRNPAKPQCLRALHPVPDEGVCKDGSS